MSLEANPPVVAISPPKDAISAPASTAPPAVALNAPFTKSNAPFASFDLTCNNPMCLSTLPIPPVNNPIVFVA